MSRHIQSPINIPNDSIKSVNFYGTDIKTFLHEGRALVALKEVCQSLGISWSGQYRKVIRDRRRYRPVLVRTSRTSGVYKSWAVPLTYFNNWLNSINPSRVSVETRANLQQYQDECSKVLHDYWNEGSAVNPRSHEPAWQEARSTGRVIRVDTAKTIQDFVQYSKAQGSTDAETLFSKITRTTYAGLDFIGNYHDDCKDLRNALSVSDLSLLSTAENLVRKTMLIGMAAGIHHQQILENCKDTVIRLNDLNNLLFLSSTGSNANVFASQGQIPLAV